MAQDATLEGLRSQVLDSIKGRKFGLDPSGYIVGQLTARDPITAATSLTTATVIVPYGLTTLQSATAGIPWSMSAPVPGVTKQLMSISTGGGTVTLASGTFQTTAGTTTTIATMNSVQGAQLTLVGISTAVWFVADNKNASSAAGTPLVTFA